MCIVLANDVVFIADIIREICKLARFLDKQVAHKNVLKRKLRFNRQERQLIQQYHDFMCGYQYYIHQIPTKSDLHYYMYA